MLRRAHSLLGVKIQALDGDMGQVDDFYFDDLEWIVRYMIVRTGSWFSEKHVMLSPTSVRDVVWEDRSIFVDLTKEQIKESPDLDLMRPVTREQELELARHYQWPTYWADTPADTRFGYTGLGVAPMLPDDGPSSERLPEHIVHDIVNTGISNEADLHRGAINSEEGRSEIELDRAAQAEGLHHHLRGVKELTGYHVAATDGDVGHVDDFFIDEETWQIHYLLVDTGKWLPGRKVLISTKWISDILWEDSRVYVELTREQIKSSPEYDPKETVERQYEGVLHQHYGFPPYWA